MRAAVTGYLRTLANEVAIDGVTVNTVLPGYTATERLEALAESTMKQTGATHEAVYAGWMQRLRRDGLGRPDELAAIIAFVASERAGFMTGQAILVDGGTIKPCFSSFSSFSERCMAGITETEWIWKNGTFIKWADAQVHVLSHSMQFGSSAFEGIRCYNTPKGPAIFRLREHLTRLVNSVKIYRMELEYSVDQLMAAHRDLVVRNKLDSCYIRPMVVRGYGAAGMVPFDSPIEVYIPCWPWGAYLGEGALENGVDACVSAGIAWHPTPLPRWPRSPATISAASW